MEVESGTPDGRRDCRGAAVRCAVVLAVCALLLSLAALAVMLLITPQDPPRSLQLQPQDSQVCALLYSQSPVLEDGRLKWVVDDTAGCENLDQQFKYDNNFGRLKITSEGVYHIFVQVVTQCYFVKCKEQGKITLTVHHNSDPILSLSLHLSPTSNKTLSASTDFSFPLEKDDFLYVALTVRKNDVPTGFIEWQLENSSILKVSKIPGNSQVQVTENNYI